MTSNRRVLVGVILALIALVAAVLYWFEPQALFIDETVNEAVPQAKSDEGDTQGSMASKKKGDASTPKILSEGSFRELDHSAMGVARLIELEDGSRFVRFEEFEVENGPDLNVYLSTTSAESESGFDENFVDLGDLKGNVGDQNYAVPPSTDLGRYRSVVVWCRRFSVGFAAAPIELAS